MGAWDEAKERQFLMAIIHVQSVSTPNWNQVAKLMESTGDGFTGNGLRQKFDKMKKAAKEQFGELPAVDGEDGAATPIKRGRKANPDNATKKTPKRKAGKKAVGEEAEDDAGEDEESPAKRVKKEENAGTDEDENDGLI